MESLSTRLREALKLDCPYLERLRISDAVRKAAVLIVFGADRAGDPHLLITQRTETVQTHKGQMAFPGGSLEEGEDWTKAAIREAEEEVGIPPEKVEILGEMPKLATPSGFSVTPIVGLLRCSLEEAPLRPCEAEIARAFWIPYSQLERPGTYRRESIAQGEIQYPIHVYQVGEYRIWGMTGAILKNLLDRLAALR